MLNYIYVKENYWTPTTNTGLFNWEKQTSTCDLIKEIDFWIKNLNNIPETEFIEVLCSDSKVYIVKYINRFVNMWEVFATGEIISLDIIAWRKLA